MKSDADDYRYFRIPDLVMLHIARSTSRDEGQMPEMPRELLPIVRRSGGASNDLEMLTCSTPMPADLPRGDPWEAGASAAGAKWWLGELSAGCLKMQGVSLEGTVDRSGRRLVGVADGKLKT